MSKKMVTGNKLNRLFKTGIKPILNSITGKLDNSKVINNLLATVAGYALDARQGKVLDDKIAALNSNLSDMTDYGTIMLDYASAYTLQKKFSATAGIKAIFVTPLTPLARKDVQFSGNYAAGTVTLRASSQSASFITGDTVEVSYILLRK